MRVSLAALIFLSPLVAIADPTKDECVDADTQAQVARTAGKFTDAKRQLEICVSQSCPELVRSDCTQRLDEVTRNTPSVIFDVKDASGSDLAATKVTMDGQPLLERLDGKAVAIDPGEHTFVFTAAGHLPNTQHVLVHEGDRDRRVNVIVGAEALETPTATAPIAETKTPSSEIGVVAPSSPANGQKIAGVVLGISGLVGMGLAGVLTGVSATAWQNSQNECSTSSCTAHDQAVSDHNTAYDFAVAATVLVIGGGALAATGLLLFLTAPHTHEKSSSMRLRLLPLVGAVNGVSLGGVF